MPGITQIMIHFLCKGLKQIRYMYMALILRPFTLAMSGFLNTTDASPTLAMECTKNPICRYCWPMCHDLGRQHEIHWHWLLTRIDQRESPAELPGEKSGFWCYGRGQRVALGGPSGQAGSPSPLSRRRHWPLPLAGRYLGHNPQPPAPPKGDWPVEADQARLTLPWPTPDLQI